MSIDGPHPGNWFAIAFISWTDPNNDRIEQQGTMIIQQKKNINQFKNISTFFLLLGLAASCETLLLSEMSVIRTTPIILNGGAQHTNKLVSNESTTEPISYKFFVPRHVDRISWKVTVLNACPDCLNVSVFVQANSLPTATDYLQSAVIYPNQSGDVTVEFYPQTGQWHYVEFEFIDTEAEKNATVDNTTTFQFDFRVELIFHEDDSVDTERLDRRQFEEYPLLRQTYREFFMFDYDLLPDTNGTVPTSVNLTSGFPSLFKFGVGDVYDIGGTLSFAVAMKNVLKSGIPDDAMTTGMGMAVAEKLVDKLDEEPKQGPAKQNQTVIICMRLGEPGIPTWPDKCVYGRHEHEAASVINNTDTDTSTGLVHVPFPESGSWYVTMGLFCHGASETAARITIIDSVKEFIKKYNLILNDIRAPCPCAERWSYYRKCVPDEKCLKQLNETETLKIKECMMDLKCTTKHKDMSRKFEIHHKSTTEQSVSIESTCNASVVFTLSSSPCVAGRCGRYGRCYHYMSGGFVFSTCLCIKGYRGWDCTEDSQVPSSLSILLASLLLTLSNLLFIPSIYFAVRRQFYTESVIYFFAMFFSTFYHACDSGEDEYSFCLVKIGVLQFCDFYCGLLAIWVTLIAMAHVRQTFVSLLHMFGAILLAFGTELNKQSLWVFLAPALTGLCLISVSWGMKCRKTKRVFPSRNYLAVFLPIGAVLVMVGLVCYAFLQTKQNYHIVHSIWHMVMALSILCLLPNRKTFVPKC